MKRTLTVASRSVSRGLAAVEPEAGTLVVYAAKDGETALDGDGINSPFASAFVKNLPTPGLEVRRLLPVGQQLWLKELESYIPFPPLQDPETYNLVQVMAQVKKMAEQNPSK